MEILVLLIPLSIVLMGIAAAIFIWAVNNKQFEQLDRHGFDVLEDESGESSK
jgi:cbb3-type cytochrome oxidase maturation protein